MKWLGSGMQARFLLAMGGAMVVVVAILAVLLGRQAAMDERRRAPAVHRVQALARARIQAGDASVSGA